MIIDIYIYLEIFIDSPKPVIYLKGGTLSISMYLSIVNINEFYEFDDHTQSFGT